MPLIKASPHLVEDQGVTVYSIDRTQLRHDLQNDDPDERRAAVRRAGRLGAADLLAQHLGVETNKEVREAIQTTLIRIGGGDAVKPLLDLLRSEDAGLRNGVIETLQSMGDIVIPEIQLLLDDPDPDVRIFVVNILLSLQSQSVPDMALKVVLSDADVNVCAAALDVLAEVGRPDMTQALRGVAARFPDQPFMTFAVRSALKRIG